MKNEELIECIQAEMRGEEIEYTFTNRVTTWVGKSHTGWDTPDFIYRIKAKPPVLVPHYAAICWNGSGRYLVTDYLFTSDKAAKDYAGDQFVALDLQCPRMLEVRK